MANNQYNFLDYAGLSLFWNNVKSIIDENELATATALTNLDTRVDNLEASKADKGHTHSKSQIIDFPTSLPASDVYSWAKQSTKPSYSFSEITSKPTTVSGYGITDALTSKYIIRKGDFQHYVILLCKIGTGSTNTVHTINGTFWTVLDGVARYQAAYINIHCSDWSAGHNEYYGFTPFGLGTMCRLVTCTYQSSKYLAITFENIQAIDIYFDGTYNNILFTPILYYTEGNTVVENSEIYNSISEVTYNKIPIISSAQTALTSSNYNSYSPKLDGTGATGTWGISITGNANYATTAGSAKASDVKAWAKADTKPSYTGTEVTLSGYSKNNSYTAIESGDSVQAAIAKLEGAINGLEDLLASI